LRDPDSRRGLGIGEGCSGDGLRMASEIVCRKYLEVSFRTR